MYLFTFFLLYTFLVFFLRSFLVWKKTGVNPWAFKEKDDAHGFNGRVFKILMGIEIIVLGIHAFAPEWEKYLLPFWYLEFPILKRIGWGFLLLSLVWVWIAQSQMAASWRVGIDEEHKTELVTHGLFRFSRNPIFLGIILANVGLFLVLPNAFILLIVSLSTLAINTQIRLEEDFLEGRFGEEYLEYCKRVRRWI